MLGSDATRAHRGPGPAAPASPPKRPPASPGERREGDAPRRLNRGWPSPSGRTSHLYARAHGRRAGPETPGGPAVAGQHLHRIRRSGRVLNAVQMPQEIPAWIVERPAFAFATRETVDALALAFRSVRSGSPIPPRPGSAHGDEGRRIPAPAPLAPERPGRGRRPLLPRRPVPAARRLLARS